MRVLLDAIGARHIEEGHIEVMRDAGCDIRWFRPVDSGAVGEANHRTHRKVLVCDEVTAFTGGVGIADEWLGDARDETEWRDTHFEVTGPAVAGLRGAFVGNWADAADDIFDPGIDRFPTLDASGTVAVQVVPGAAEAGWSNIATMFRTLVRLAEQRIRITTAYLNPDDHLLALLADAARRGVSVELLLPGPHADKRFVQLTSESVYKPLLDAGVTIWNFQPSMLHAKVLTIDGAGLVGWVGQRQQSVDALRRRGQPRALRCCAHRVARRALRRRHRTKRRHRPRPLGRSRARSTGQGSGREPREGPDLMSIRGFLVAANGRAGSADRAAMQRAAGRLATHGPTELIWVDDEEAMDTTIAASEGRRLVIAGGDGTVHVALNRMAAAAAGAPSDAVAVLPAGTGNDFARNVGLPLGLDAAADVAATGTATPFPALRFADGELAANNVHFGLGLVAAERAAGWKRLAGRFAYPLATLAEGLTYDGQLLDIDVDGSPWRGRVLAGVVLLGPSVGGGIELLDDVAATDEAIDVVVAELGTRRARLGIGWTALRGSIADHEHVTRRRGRLVRVATVGGGPVRMDLDGEIALRPSPVEIELLPRAWAVITAPRGAPRR